MTIEVSLFDEAFLQTFCQRHKHLSALQVGTIQYGIDRSRESVLMCLVLSTIEEVIDGVAVSQHDTVVTPFVTQDINQQTVAGATGLTFEALISTHHLTNVSFLHQCLEGRQIGLPQVAVGGVHIHGVAQRLRTAVYSIVLGTGMGLEVLIVIALHTQNSLNAQDGIHIGVFTAGLLTTSPTRVTEDIDIRTPERQLGVARIVSGTHSHIEKLRVIVVGTVPVGTSLVAHLREDIVYKLCVEGGSHTNGLWIHGVVTLAYTMTGFTPPVVGGNAQTVDGYTLVHHQTDFLFGS